MSGQQWTRDEVVALEHLEDFLRTSADKEPLADGVADVIFARDRQAVLTAVARYPELLTDQGDAGFRLAALTATLMGAERVTKTVEHARASVQAIREARG